MFPLQESSTDSKLSEASSTPRQNIRDPRLKKLEQVTDSKSDSETTTDNAESEKLEKESSVVNTAIIADKSPDKTVDKTVNKTDKPVDKVGFDLEFVPLDKDDDTTDATPTVTYNRDRPLGKNRYFKKDPKARIMQSDSDSGSDFGENKVSSSDTLYIIDKKGKRKVGGVGHRNYRQKAEHAKENDGETATGERKKGDIERGRRRHSGNRHVNSSSDKSGEYNAGHDRLDGRNQRGNRPGGRPDDHPVARRGHRPDHPVQRERPDRPKDWDRPGRRPEDYPGRGRRGGRPRGRGPEHPGERSDMGPRHPSRREHGEYEGMRGGRFDHREEWSRGRGHLRYDIQYAIAGILHCTALYCTIFYCYLSHCLHNNELYNMFDRSHRGHALEGANEGRFRNPQPVENTGRLPERRDQGFDRPDGMAYERVVGEEPPFKKSRSSPPRPLFTEKEISEIREKRRDSPERFDQHYERHDEPWQHDNFRQPPPEYFNNQGTHLGPRPPNIPSSRGPPFAPAGMHRELLRHSQPFSGDVEIPLELTLDNESEILRSVSLFILHISEFL